MNGTNLSAGGSSSPLLGERSRVRAAALAHPCARSIWASCPAGEGRSAACLETTRSSRIPLTRRFAGDLSPRRGEEGRHPAANLAKFVRTPVSLRALLALLLLSTSGSTIAQLNVKSEGKAIQVRTDELVVYSEKVGRDFLVEVTLLDQLQPGRKYAAVYTVDGGLGVAGPASRLLIAGQRTEPYFNIAIGYPNATARHSGPRNTDLAHRRVVTDEGHQVGGGGAAFEAFILQELRPYLERRYPLDPQRAVLLGHSGGGLFAATVLVTNPDAFYAYVIGGLPLWYESPLREQAQKVAPHGKGQRVFIGFAPSDARNSASDEFAAPLSSPGSKFVVRQEVFEEETHNSLYLLLLSRGLRFVLPTETLLITRASIDLALLDRYVGTYRIDARQTLTFTRHEGGLMGQVSPRGRYEFAPHSQSQFFSDEINAIVEFDAPINGKSPAVVIRRDRTETTAKRVK
jgi:predicted alpha/beta superfamily hydrolase